MRDADIKEMAERCRTLAGGADVFTKKRLLDLAARYDAMAGKRSPASRMIERLPLNVAEQAEAKPGARPSPS